MQKNKNRPRMGFTTMKSFALSLLLLVLLLPLQANAQSVWTSPTHADGFTIEGYKPNFDRNIDDAFSTSFPSSAWFLNGQYSAHPSLRLGAEIGVSHHGIESDVADITARETAFGNVQLNAEWLTPVDNLSASLAVRVPTATDNQGAFTGMFVDLDRVGAFTPDMWTIKSDINYRHNIGDGLSLRVKGGPLMMIETFDNETETEFGARYAVQGWYDAPRVMVGAGINGTSNFSMESIDGIDRTSLAVGGSIIGKFNRYQPGISLQVPVTSNYMDAVDWVAGVSLRVPLFTGR